MVGCKYGKKAVKTLSSYKVLNSDICTCPRVRWELARSSNLAGAGGTTNDSCQVLQQFNPPGASFV